MSLIINQIKKANEQGQANIQKHINALQEQNNQIIENLNEIILLQKKICDKVGVTAEVEGEEE